MEYYMLLQKSSTKLTYSKPDYTEMIESSVKCERFDFTDIKAFRVIIDDKEYRLSKQYVFLKENKTLYVLEC